MRNSGKLARRLLVLVVPGAMALGTTCVSDMRDAVVAAGLDYVEGAAGTFLDTVIPIEDFITGDGE